MEGIWLISSNGSLDRTVGKRLHCTNNGGIGHTLHSVELSLASWEEVGWWWWWVVVVVVVEGVGGV